MGAELFTVTGPGYVGREELVSLFLCLAIFLRYTWVFVNLLGTAGRYRLCVLPELLHSCSCGESSCIFLKLRSAAKGSVTAELGVWSS